MQVATASNIVTFATKGRVVIPSKLRREFEIKVGTRAAVIATPEGILLRPVTREYIRSLRGSLKNKRYGMRSRKAGAQRGSLKMALKVLDGWALTALGRGRLRHRS